MKKSRVWRISLENVSKAFVLIVIYTYFWNIIPIENVLDTSIATGGDTASHFYPLKFLHDELIPRGRITGWMPGWFGGIPVFQFYFPLTYVMMSFMGLFIPLEVAFKIGTLIGILALPAFTWFCVRSLGYEFPTPQIAASLTLLFLFMETFTIWGGNIASTFAGQFSHSMSLAFTMLFMGTVYRGMKTKKHTLLNILLVACISATHIYTLLYAASSSVYLLFAINGKMREKLAYLANVYGVGFLIVAFWMFPMFANLGHTTEFNYQYLIVEDLIPPIFWPVIFIFLAGVFRQCDSLKKKVIFTTLNALSFLVLLDTYGLDYKVRQDNTLFTGAVAKLIYGDEFFARNLQIFAFFPVIMFAFMNSRDIRERYFIFSMIASFGLFMVGDSLGLVDVRFIPFMYMSLIVCCLSPNERGLRHANNRWVIPIVIVLLTVLWVNDHRALLPDYVQRPDSKVSIRSGPIDEIMDGEYEGYLPYWASYNYEGYEKKRGWPLYKSINSVIMGDSNSSRVVYEHNVAHERFGSIRAFESLPLFSKRSTLEGLFFQSSISTPFVYYIQSEVSEQKSCPFAPKYKCTELNLEDGIMHMRMFNVGNYIAYSKKGRESANAHPQMKIVAEIEQYSIYELDSPDSGYVIVPKYVPNIMDYDNWKEISYNWFRNMSVIDIPIVFASELEGLEGFPVADSLSSLKRHAIEADCDVRTEVGFERIEFWTECVGKPHIVRFSHYPNWNVNGADRIYLVSPSFMMVIPQQGHVILEYGSNWSEKAGFLMTLAGFLAIALKKGEVFS